MVFEALLAAAQIILPVPLCQQECILIFEPAALHAKTAGHVLGLHGFPIDRFPAEVLQQQAWALTLALREELPWKGTVDQEILPALHARERHVTP